ncbi:MAG: ATP-dependent DNA helicase RecG [Eubacteriales bacterium]|nr:ATP-dependent DNA helicase RecG [Eubacteriales bacterium]
MVQTRFEAQEAFLNQPIDGLAGLGPKTAEILHRMSIFSYGDLLKTLPRRYENSADLHIIEELEDGHEAAFIAEVAQIRAPRFASARQPLRCLLFDDSGQIEAVFFNQNYLKDRLSSGGPFLFFGRVRRNARRLQLQNPRFQMLTYDANGEIETFFSPIYPLSQGLKQSQMQRFLKNLIQACARRDAFPDYLPIEIERKYQLCSAAFAYEKIHYPRSAEELAIAKRRLIFEELFFMRYALAQMKRKNQSAAASCLCLSEEARAEFKASIRDLPFKLSEAQLRSLSEICKDMERSQAMTRLLQGDVGSGKTVVAALAMRYVALCGGQSALMAPTSILAEQHYHSICSYLGLKEDEIALITGQMKARERGRVEAGLASGQIKYLIGTQALTSERIQFNNLRLAVTDEQQRFGVLQRLKLGSDEAGRAHVLVMSATPIPRSLALILHGDLDLSILDRYPRKRQTIDTYTVGLNDRDTERVAQLGCRQIEAGGAVFYVCPVIEEQEDGDLISLTSFVERVKSLYPQYRVAFLHGGQKEVEKQETMRAFAAGDYQVLVSTSVVEVGIDVERANFMVIMNAERFGIAQMHQLRGRIGRGHLKSICILASDAPEDSRAFERMRSLCRSNDGFKLAERDLELRGQGDFFGTRQHGMPQFRIANLYENGDVLKLVNEAVDLIECGNLRLSEEAETRLDAGLKSYFVIDDPAAAL